VADAALALTLYGRTYCHLCDDMAAALAPLAIEWGVDVRYIDVDTDPAIEARYGENVPVLTHGDTMLCQHFLDPERVRAYLAKIR
jgi:thiol-disulfide isomerase/thioredoxin